MYVIDIMDPSRATPEILDIECELLITGDLVGTASVNPHAEWSDHTSSGGRYRGDYVHSHLPVTCSHVIKSPCPRYVCLCTVSYP